MSDKLRREIGDGLRRSRKYATLCEDTLSRIADWAAARHQAPKAALKAAKRKLHQVYGAYLDQLDLARVEGLVEDLPTDPTDDAIRAACREILACQLLAEVPEPKVVIDLACGLHPFALPWMELPLGARYHAYDIDHRLVAAVNAFASRVGWSATAECKDILVSPPDVDADLAFLLKTVPCLEQQEKGATVRLLSRLRARHVVISFPARTLGGRDKGMRGHYDEAMGRIAEELGAPTTRLTHPNETFYVVALC
jgi:16S rRNA (guanine(1405)-N(7))-methyltransferase